MSFVYPPAGLGFPMPFGPSRSHGHDLANAYRAMYEHYKPSTRPSQREFDFGFAPQFNDTPDDTERDGTATWDPKLQAWHGKDAGAFFRKQQAEIKRLKEEERLAAERKKEKARLAALAADPRAKFYAPTKTAPVDAHTAAANYRRAKYSGGVDPALYGPQYPQPEYLGADPDPYGPQFPQPTYSGTDSLSFGPQYPQPSWSYMPPDSMYAAPVVPQPPVEQPALPQVVQLAQPVQRPVSPQLKPVTRPTASRHAPPPPQPVYSAATEAGPSRLLERPVSSHKPSQVNDWNVPPVSPVLLPIPPKSPSLWVIPRDGTGKSVITHSYAAWYAEHVYEVLKHHPIPREGTGGASDSVWGEEGRHKAAYARLGQVAPKHSNGFGHRNEYLEPGLPGGGQTRLERKDPYRTYERTGRNGKISPEFFTYVDCILHRMAVTPTAVIAAVWFLRGLGLRYEAGSKGARLRKHLLSVLWDSATNGDKYGVEKRVAMLGLLLAGKWHDDNSFLTKSWSQVTGIPLEHVNLLESAALADLHYSLYISLQEWDDHLTFVRDFIVKYGNERQQDSLVLAMVVQMCVESHEALKHDRSTRPSPTADFELPDHSAITAADEVTSRLSDANATSDVCLSDRASSSAAQQAIAAPLAYSSGERHVASAASGHPSAGNHRVATALLEQIVSTVDHEDDDDEEFLDYDGAQRWLPTRAEQRRHSNPSSRDDRPVDWQAAISSAEFLLATTNLAPPPVITPSRHRLASRLHPHPPFPIPSVYRPTTTARPATQRDEIDGRLGTSAQPASSAQATAAALAQAGDVHHHDQIGLIGSAYVSTYRRPVSGRP